MAMDSPTGRSDRCALIAATAARCAAVIPSRMPGEVLAQHDVACPVALHTGGGLGRAQRRPLDLDDLRRQTGPGQHLRQVRLVQRHTDRDPVPESGHHPVAEPGEQLRRVRVQPGSVGGEPVRRGEVAERHGRGETAFEAPVDHRLVVVQRGRIELAADRLDPGPFGGEAKGVEPHACRQVQIRRPQLPGVAGGDRTSPQRSSARRSPGTRCRWWCCRPRSGGRRSPRPRGSRSGTGGMQRKSLEYRFFPDAVARVLGERG